jgi:4-hydroxy-3-polyprenylbenzoate decarboxylase
MSVESAFIGITGASGAPYAVRLIEALVENDVFVEICASEMGEKVLAYELGVPDATVISPASVSTLGNIANGTGTNLLHRVADVALKERKWLVILEREMPYSLVHIRNMAQITEAGGIVVSAAPGFYNHPETMEDLIDFVVGKVLDVMGVGHELVERWGHKRRG